MYTLLDTQDFIRVKQALGENNFIFNDPASLPYTDWPEEIYRDGIEHSYNLSLSGAAERSATIWPEHTNAKTVPSWKAIGKGFQPD